MGSHTGFQVTYMWNTSSWCRTLVWNPTPPPTILIWPPFQFHLLGFFSMLLFFRFLSPPSFLAPSHHSYLIPVSARAWSSGSLSLDSLSTQEETLAIFLNSNHGNGSATAHEPIQACQAIVRPGQSWLQARLGFMWENSSLAAFSSIDCHHWSFNSCLLLSNQPFTLKSLGVRKNSAVLDNCTSLPEAFEWESSSPWLQFFMLVTTVKTCMQGKGWLWVHCVNSQVSLRSNATAMAAGYSGETGCLNLTVNPEGSLHSDCQPHKWT